MRDALGSTRRLVRDVLSSPRTIPLAVAAITLVGLLLRLRWLGDSLYGDEVEAFYNVSGHGLGRVIDIVNGGGPELSPPLYFILAWFSVELFGTSVESLRLVSMISGVASIPLAYALGRSTVSARAGLIAAALVALSPFLVFFSSEARPYSLVLVLCLISTLALLKAVRARSLGWWIAYAAASCAAIYTHYTALFVLIVQLIWALVSHPEARRRLLVANVAVAAGFAPWIPTLLKEAGSPGTKIYALLEPFTFAGARRDLVHLWIGSRFQALSTIPGGIALGVALGGIVVATAAAIIGRPAGRRTMVRMPSRDAALVLLLAFGVPLAVALYSAARPTVWNAWDLIGSWPAFAVCAGALLTAGRNAWRPVAIAAVIGAFTFASLKMLESRYHRPDYTAAVSSIVSASPNPNAPVVNVPDLSPGPTVELETAFDLIDASQRHPVLRLGRAPLAVESRAKPFTVLAPEPGAQVARQAVRLAGSGKLFLVTPGVVPIATLDELRRMPARPSSNRVIGIFAAFMRALPARFRLVAMRSYTGMNRVTVYTFQG